MARCEVVSAATTDRKDTLTPHSVSTRVSCRYSAATVGPLWTPVITSSTKARLSARTVRAIDMRSAACPLLTLKRSAYPKGFPRPPFSGSRIHHRHRHRALARTAITFSATVGNLRRQRNGYVASTPSTRGIGFLAHWTRSHAVAALHAEKSRRRPSASTAQCLASLVR
jgi:hypothetical protein